MPPLELRVQLPLATSKKSRKVLNQIQTYLQVLSLILKDQAVALESLAQVLSSLLQHLQVTMSKKT